MAGAEDGVHWLKPHQPVHQVAVRHVSRVYSAEPGVDLAPRQGTDDGGQVPSGPGLDIEARCVLQGLLHGAHGREQVTPHVDPQRPFLLA
jgi:hypothetical protein